MIGLRAAALRGHFLWHSTQAKIARPCVGAKSWAVLERQLTDYWVSKLFFDLQQDAKLAAEYRADMPGVLARYEIKPDVRQALLEDDVGKIAPLVNAYLLRFYFQIRGMPQDEFIARLHALQAGKGKAHG